MESDLVEKGWQVFLVPFEDSSKGQILKVTETNLIITLKHFDVKFQLQKKIIKNMSKIALLCTFSIFHAYQTKEWINPPLLKP